MCVCYQCVKQTSRMRCQRLNEGGSTCDTTQRPPEVWRRIRFFVFGYLVVISFPNRIDVIITEISKEVENNNVARLNAYVKQYLPRRNGAAGGSYEGAGSCGRF